MADENKVVENKGTAPTKDDGMGGKFVDSLKRTNREIKNDRAESIAEDAETSYRRRVEDLIRDKKNLERERRNMLDLSPSNTQSLMVASEFNSKKFFERDMEIGIELRNLDIQIEIGKQRYFELFGLEV